MSLREAYQALTTKLQELARQHAVLESREAEKAAEREKIILELKAAGINVDTPNEEIARLDAEIAANLQEMTVRVETFERDLKAATLAKSSPIPSTVQATPDISI